MARKKKEPTNLKHTPMILDMAERDLRVLKVTQYVPREFKHDELTKSAEIERDILLMHVAEAIRQWNHLPAHDLADRLGPYASRNDVRKRIKSHFGLKTATSYAELLCKADVPTEPCDTTLAWMLVKTLFDNLHSDMCNREYALRLVDLLSQTRHTPTYNIPGRQLLSLMEWTD